MESGEQGHGEEPSLSVGVFRRYLVYAGLAWTLVVALSLVWNLRVERQHTEELAKKEARANFNKDQAFRYWATTHGGVYVPATDETPPNPYLSHIPERDITTPKGRDLTLMNPAYMLRQMMEQYGELYGVKGDITSLKPLNPINEPDPWQRQALKAFERGAEEVSEFTEIDGTPYLRLMRPMITEPGCLKCHAHQGYEVGDVRGGVGVSVPMAPYLAAEDRVQRNLSLSHGGIWLIGVAGLLLFGREGARRIRAQQRAALAVRESEARYHAVLDNVSDGIFVHDMEGRFVDVNRRACESLGYSREELLGLRVGDIDPTWSGEHVARVWADLPTDEVVTLGEGEHRRKDGNRFPVEVRGRRVRLDGRDVIVAVARDVSEQRAARTALERSNAELQQFAYVASHDLQEPLRTVTTYVQLLQHRYGGQLDKDADDYIGFMVEAAKRMRSLIQDLLAYSRLEAQPRPFEPVDLNTVLGTVRANLETALAASGGRLTTEGLPAVCGDPAQLTSLFQNLVANAVRYRASQRPPDIDIKAERRARQWVVSVADNGIGIEPQYHDRVFKVFQRLSPGHGDDGPGGGTGIGLAIARKVVERHGGRIWFESQPGRGTTFYFTLPAADAEEGCDQG